jgi:restriction endonuclease S subunit
VDFASNANPPSIRKTTVEDWRIVIPPLAEQERVIKLLDEADGLRKLRANADDRTAALISAIFHKMFGNVEQNSNKWPWKAVDDVCDLVRGSSPRPRSDPRDYGGPIPRLMIEDITRDGWSVTPRVDSLTELGATMSRPVKAGTIVMAVSGNIGLCAQLAVDACVHDGFVAFKDLRADLFLPLFFGMAMSQMRQSHLRNQAGAIFQNITTTDVKAMKIPVPPLSLQEEFADRVKEIRELEAEQARSRGRLDDLFESMLHRAFSEEL